MALRAHHLELHPEVRAAWPTPASRAARGARFVGRGGVHTVVGAAISPGVMQDPAGQSWGFDAAAPPKLFLQTVRAQFAGELHRRIAMHRCGAGAETARAFVGGAWIPTDRGDAGLREVVAAASLWTARRGIRLRPLPLLHARLGRSST